MKWCKESVLTLLFSFTILSCAKENQCPGSKTSCPVDSTCCPLHDGSYGCCPIKNAVCCQDSVHCCPGGFSCDVIKGVCQMGDKSKPLLKKIPAVPTVNEIAEGNVVICASGERQCPPDHSCCSVPGSDKVHCCPGGYSCEKGLCQESSIQFPGAIFTSSAAKIVKCNQKFACPDRHTCCKADTSYLCCPLPQAVCCTDNKHCCPRGLKCSADGKTCSSGVHTLLAISASPPMSLMEGFNKLLHLMMVKFAKKGKLPSVEYTKLSVAQKIPKVNSVICPDGQSECPDGNTCCKLSSGQWGCCPLPKAVCCSDGVHCCPNGDTCDVSEGTCTQKSGIITMLTMLPALKKTPGENSVVCPGEQSQCPDGDTCCKLSSGQWGCCPLPNAVCCSDGVHCCPNGYTCDVSEGTCTQKSGIIAMLTKLPALKKTPDENSVVCPDGQSQCPDGNTCCKLSSGQWGCCPLPNAVCCSDGVHCCPNGYTCDVSEGTCNQNSGIIPMLTKLPALKKTPDENSVVCPDGQSQCPDGNTCCKLSSGQWGCCPLPKAVCCSDGVHCCPNGYTCDVSEGTCTQERKSIPILTKLRALKNTPDENNVICPDGQSQCPDGNTCCKLSSGQWGCCPLPKAVCCSDGVHCCPNGYTCDVSEGTCTQKSGIITMLTMLSALKKTPGENSVVCPDGQSECPDGNTCCKLSSGQWGCCPLPNAVCCSDGVHCCPNGYTCDVSEGTCTQKGRIIPMLTKLPALKKTPGVNSVVCPGGQSQCPDGNTCCKLSSGQWGCCPLPNAVCCSDGVHCCPNGYTCDVSEGTCTQEEKSIPTLTKLTALKKTPDENSVVCPDGQSQCPDGNTCCKLSSGQWGCCPLPKAVCCSDGVHCCPNGYTCDVSEGTCTQKTGIIPMLTKLPALKKTPDENSIVCPDGQSECPDGNTCCKLSSGQWGCCPLPNAVCCSDGVHCCPNGYTCDVSEGTCTQNSGIIPMLTKLPALMKTPDENSVVCPDGQSQCPDGNTCCKLSSGQWGCCPLPKAVCCSDGVHCCPNGYTCDVSEGTCTREGKSIPMLTKQRALKNTPDENVICPDGQSQCPDGNTCCKLSSGQWGCCPLPKAVCCSDGVHCCPNGYTCDVSEGTCTREGKSIPMLTKLRALKNTPDENVICPDGQSQCPDGNTCCKLSSGQWGCCPLPKAVCCSDGVHCCPNGYTCDVSEGTCTQEGKSIPILTKLRALKNTPDENNVICPDGQSQCPDGNTCCKLSSGQWGCCPLPKAVCCSDGVHCCPNGYTCDVAEGTCTREGKSIPMLTKLRAINNTPDDNNVICPDGQSQCPDGNTCCKLSSGQWGCCPLPKAVCCSDGVHCCPNGYTCDVSEGTCTQEGKSIPILTKLRALRNTPDENNVICPDGQSQCPDGNTCCKLSSGQWGCCPLPKAVCCSDGVHCCRNGYTCDVSEGTCTREGKSIPMLTKQRALKNTPDENVICPDGQSQCPDGNTCCKLSSGQWGCCPLPKAVCCSDGVHCCPNGYTCDVSEGTCTQEGKSIPILTKLRALKNTPDENNVICPDGQSQCPDGNTCCKLSSGQWGCCPLPKAVCCSDGVHCCPNGYTCDVAEGTCTREGKSIPMLTKLRALKSTPDDNNVICPDGQSQCPDGNTCCKLSSGQWGCCPLPKAVCCSDGVHCCPNGYTCDVSEGTCTQAEKSIPMLTKLSALKNTPDENSVVCPDGQSQCPDGNTCCQFSWGQWGCCPYPKAVCCSDGVHCCRNGYTCDVSKGTCNQEEKSVPMLSKLPALKKTLDENSVICPDGQSECPDRNTCCKLPTGQWGCCPLGYTCHVSEGSCKKRSLSISMFEKVGAVEKTSDERAFDGIVCPDQKYQCPKGNTCCKLPSGTYGCCPLEDAVCCSDGKHCCPKGYTCDVKEGKCNKNAEDITINNIPVSRTSPGDEVEYIDCPDGSTCMDYETCCELRDGSFGCCPMPHAVCCSDHLHCCPSGYRCDLAAEMCVTGKVRLPVMKKMKSPRRPKIDHGNIDEKIHFIPGRAQAGDDDAVLWLERP